MFSRRANGAVTTTRVATLNPRIALLFANGCARMSLDIERGAAHLRWL